MSSKTKISRKELKEPDRFQQISSRLVQGVARHRNFFLGLLGVLIIAAGVMWVFTEKQKEESLRMEGLYFQIDKLIENESGGDSAAVDSKIKGIMGQFQEGPQKTRARLLLADRAYKKGDYGSALALYNEIIQAAVPTDTNHTLARQGMAFSYEGQKDYKKAIETYKSIIDTSPKFPLFYVYVGLSRSYELSGDNKNAILILREMQNRFPEHSGMARILSKLKELEGQA